MKAWRDIFCHDIYAVNKSTYCNNVKNLSRGTKASENTYQWPPLTPKNTKKATYLPMAAFDPLKTLRKLPMICTKLYILADFSHTKE